MQKRPGRDRYKRSAHYVWKLFTPSDSNESDVAMHYLSEVLVWVWLRRYLSCRPLSWFHRHLNNGLRPDTRSSVKICKQETQIPLCPCSHLACTSRRFDRITDTPSGNDVLHILAMAGVCTSSHVAPCPCRTPSIGASGPSHSCSMQKSQARVDDGHDDCCGVKQSLVKGNRASPILWPGFLLGQLPFLPCLWPMA